MEQIKASIETIAKASVAQQTVSTEYFWDRFNAVIKFALLNQTEIINQFGFNITQKVIDCPSGLNWTILPQNVQQLLLNQQETLFYLTYYIRLRLHLSINREQFTCSLDDIKLSIHFHIMYVQ